MSCNYHPCSIRSSGEELCKGVPPSTEAGFSDKNTCSLYLQYFSTPTTACDRLYNCDENSCKWTKCKTVENVNGVQQITPVSLQTNMLDDEVPTFSSKVEAENSNIPTQSLKYCDNVRDWVVCKDPANNLTTKYTYSNRVERTYAPHFKTQLDADTRIQEILVMDESKKQAELDRLNSCTLFGNCDSDPAVPIGGNQVSEGYENYSTLDNAWCNRNRYSV